MHRGFTLVELMIALGAGIAVAGAAYMISKASLNVFEAEARISQAQFGATMGMTQLVSDVERAGFMSNPFAGTAAGSGDPGKICGDKSALGNVRAINIAFDDTTSALVSSYNGFDPDVLTLTGNFASTEQFAFRTIQGSTVYMTMQDGAMQRSIRDNQNGGPALRDIFMKGRLVRLIDSHGKETYAQIASAPVCTGLAPTPAPACEGPGMTDMHFDLSAPPASDGMVCGDWVAGGYINPVEIVRYRIGTPTVAADGISQATADLIAPDPATETQTGDDYRTELIRTELADATMTPMPAPYLNAPPPSTVVAEYAVDLNISASARVVGAPNDPTVERLSGDVTGDKTLMADIAANNPQLFTGLLIRLTTRTRAPDRTAALPVTGPYGTTRFDVFGGNAAGQADHFARLRTLVQEVALPNLGGITW